MQGKKPLVVLATLSVFLSGCVSGVNPDTSVGVGPVAELPPPAKPEKPGNDAVPRRKPTVAPAGKATKAPPKPSPKTGGSPGPQKPSSDIDSLRKNIEASVNHAVSLLQEGNTAVGESSEQNAEERKKQERSAELTENAPEGVTDVPKGIVPPLGLAGGKWETGDSGFRFHAAQARSMLSAGRPDVAASEARRAKDAASGQTDAAEAGSLLAAANVMMGRAEPGPFPATDPGWQAFEVAREGIAGRRSSSTVAAVREVTRWPSTAAAPLVPHLAAAAESSHAAEAVLGLARKLRASGDIDDAVLKLAEGYSALHAGRHEEASKLFAAASDPNPRRFALAARARLEALEAGMAAGSLSDAEILQGSEDVAGIGSGDWVEKRALRIAADRTEGARKLSFLRRLEKLEKGAGREAVAKEIDRVIADIENAGAKSTETGVVNPPPPAEWLLDPVQEIPSTKETTEAEVSGVEAADKALDSAGSLIESIENELGQ